MKLEEKINEFCTMCDITTKHEFFSIDDLNDYFLHVSYKCNDCSTINTVYRDINDYIKNEEYKNE